jgi:rubrerythrin
MKKVGIGLLCGIFALVLTIHSEEPDKESEESEEKTEEVKKQAPPASTEETESKTESAAKETPVTTSAPQTQTPTPTPPTQPTPPAQPTPTTQTLPTTQPPLSSTTAATMQSQTTAQPPTPPPAPMPQASTTAATTESQTTAQPPAPAAPQQTPASTLPTASGTAPAVLKRKPARKSESSQAPSPVQTPQPSTQAGPPMPTTNINPMAPQPPATSDIIFPKINAPSGQGPSGTPLAIPGKNESHKAGPQNGLVLKSKAELDKAAQNIKPLTPLALQATSDAQAKQDSVIEDVSSHEGQSGPDTVKAPSDRIGFRGNWVKKREWLAQTRNQKIKIQNHVQAIQAQRASFWEKYKEIQNSFDACYKQVGPSKGKIELLLGSIQDLVKKEEPPLKQLQKGAPQEAAKPSEPQKPLSQEERELAAYHDEFNESLANYKTINDLDQAINQRMERFDQQVELADKKEKDAIALYDEIWDIIDDEKARVAFYQVRGIAKEVEAIGEYINGRFIQDFDATIATAHNQMQKVKQEFTNLETKINDYLETLKQGPKGGIKKHIDLAGSESILEKAYRWAGVLWEMLKSLFIQLFEVLKNIDWSTLWHKTKSFIGTGYTKITSYAASLFSKESLSESPPKQESTQDKPQEPSEEETAKPQAPLPQPAQEKAETLESKEAQVAPSMNETHEVEMQAQPQAAPPILDKEQAPPKEPAQDISDVKPQAQNDNEFEKNLVNSMIRAMLDDEEFQKRMSLQES